MYNFIAKFCKILDICKKNAVNRVNNLGNTVRCGVVPKFSDIEVVALSITAEAYGIDSENLLFKRLEARANRCKMGRDTPARSRRRATAHRSRCTTTATSSTQSAG